MKKMLPADHITDGKIRLIRKGRLDADRQLRRTGA
jgi:hypothetical protein